MFSLFSGHSVNAVVSSGKWDETLLTDYDIDTHSYHCYQGRTYLFLDWQLI